MNSKNKSRTILLFAVALAAVGASFLYFPRNDVKPVNQLFCVPSTTTEDAACPNGEQGKAQRITTSKLVKSVGQDSLKIRRN